MRNKLIVFLVGIIAVTSLSGCHFFWKRYYDRSNEFSIVVPRWWTIDTKRPPASLLVLSPLRKNSAFRPNVTVTVADLQNEDQAEVFWEQNKKVIMAGVPGYKSHIEEGEFYSGMDRAQYIAFTLSDGRLNIRLKSAVWFRGLRVYTATCSAEADKYSKYAGTFDKMFKSFSMTYNPPIVKVRKK
jgi:hypothetical protein